MLKLETNIKKLLDFEIEILSILDFKEYYKGCNLFNDFSRKAFLKSVGIPANYFLEQSKYLQDLLLDSKEDIIKELVNSKYSNKIILVLKRNNEILNCVRLNYDDMELSYERVLLNTDIEKEPLSLTLVKEHINEGYVTLFSPKNECKKGEYSAGVFIDMPVTLKKLPELHVGSYYIPKGDEEHYLSVYTKNVKVDYNDYQSLDLLLRDTLNDLLVEEEIEIIEHTKEDPLLSRYK